MDSRNKIQQIVKDLTNKMDIITSDLRLLFEDIDKFKHKRHLIIYSYLLGYYAAKGNDNFNEKILFDSLDIFSKSLTRKTELSNLIIAIALSINKKEEEEKEKQKNNVPDDNVPRIDITETMLSNDPYSVYKDLFGDTVLEKPLSGTIMNKIKLINSKNMHYIIQNHTNKQNNIENNNQNIIIEKNNTNNIEKNNQKSNKNLNDIKAKLNDSNDNIDNKNVNKTDINIVEKGNNQNNKNDIQIDYKKNTHVNKTNIKLNPKGPQDTIQKKKIINNGNFNTIPNNNVTTKKIEHITGPKGANKIIKCFICSENFNELDKHNYKLDCKCIIHFKCFNNYIKNSIKSKDIPIVCPKCKKELNSEIIYKALNSIGDKFLIKDYETLCFDIYIKNYEGVNSDMVYYCCPTPGCENKISCKNGETKLSCPHCHKDYCIKCYRSWHDDKKCEEYIFKNSKNNNEELNKEFYDIYTNNKYRQCPKCKALMIKEEGTNKILCVCGCTFCYKCGQIMKEKHECIS